MRLAAAIALLLGIAAHGQTPPDFRLPNSAVPLAYRLDLTLNPREPEYHGTVDIRLRLQQSASIIWLNAKDLAPTSAWIETDGKRAAAKTVLAGGEFLGLALDNPAAPGEVSIGIEFAGKLDEKSSAGAFRRRDGENWYIFTAFTPIDARRAFPCFDQPEFKTPWRITLHVPEQDIAVANGREIAREREDGGRVRVTFAETKPLATEVIAFAAGPFDIVDDGAIGKPAVSGRIIVPKGHAREAAGAVGVARAVVAQLEDYTGIPYMWDKLDHLAVPGLPFGAVENPGLITYRDRVLLAAEDTAGHRQGVRSIMAHELAHQWFGNLVTQRWWDDVWLSEGMATWLGGKIVDLGVPDTERGAAAVESRARIMSIDRRAVRLDMHSRKDMDEVYSGIVYQKGAAVMRMIEGWLGEEPLRRGLQRYLNAHAYSTATTADMAGALGADRPVAAVFASYLNQPGFPRLNATADCRRGVVRIVQESALEWSTPVCTAAGCTLVTGQIGEVPIDRCPAWINNEGAGYYRTHTDSIASLVSAGWDRLGVAEKLDMLDSLATYTPAEQTALLPRLARERNPRVAAEVRRIALKLALAPGADLDALRKIPW